MKDDKDYGEDYTMRITDRAIDFEPFLETDH